MQIQVNTDGNIDGREGLVGRVSAQIESRLGRFSEQITRIEVHLGDESAGRTSDSDKRCVIEAWPACRSPVAVTSHASSVDDALSGVLDKLASLLASEFGRRDRKGRSVNTRTGQRRRSRGVRLALELC